MGLDSPDASSAEVFSHWPGNETLTALP